MNKGFVAALVTMMLCTAHAAQASLSSVAGGLGVYDSVNNVTWTSNANLMATQAASYTNGSCGTAGSTACENAFVSAVINASGKVISDTPNQLDTPTPNSGKYTLSIDDFYSNGIMTWWGAQAWVNYLNATNYGGSNQWALPTTVDSSSSYGYPDNGPGSPSASSSQMAELFYGELGKTPGSSLLTQCNAACSLFSNWQVNPYWSGTQYSTSPNEAWSIYASQGGGQVYQPKNGLSNALAVSPGQLGQASTGTNSTDGPIPLWALGALFAGIVGVASRRLKAVCT